MKIDRKTREQACLRLAAMASTPHSLLCDETDYTLGVSRKASRLAWAAWRHVAKAFNWEGDVTNPVWDAEAEAFLRDGGDPDLEDYESGRGA